MQDWNVVEFRIHKDTLSLELITLGLLKVGAFLIVLRHKYLARRRPIAECEISEEFSTEMIVTASKVIIKNTQVFSVDTVYSFQLAF